jgi:hypothetical protein
VDDIPTEARNKHAQVVRASLTDPAKVIKPLNLRFWSTKKSSIIDLVKIVKPIIFLKGIENA